jgi:hypothetical protein
LPIRRYRTKTQHQQSIFIKTDVTGINHAPQQNNGGRIQRAKKG